METLAAIMISRWFGAVGEFIIKGRELDIALRCYARRGHAPNLLLYASYDCPQCRCRVAGALSVLNATDV